MWAKFRTSKMIKKDEKELIKGECRSQLNVNEEYLCALRTKSYADFFTKAQLLVSTPTSPSRYCHNKFTEILLEPRQETVATILESAILSKKFDMKALIINYFDISAEASQICSHLLTSINQIQSNCMLIQPEVLDYSVGDYSPKQLGLIISELNSFTTLNKQDFKSIQDKYSSVLHHLNSKRKKVARKIKLIKCFNKASSICVTAACGLVAVAAIILAAHTLTALVMGPAILSLPIKPLKKKLLNFRFLRRGFLRKVGEQLDLAAKGIYILNRDFDTMSRLVARVHDEIEQKKKMLQLCLERRDDKFSLQVLRELKKRDLGFKRQVEELEEHVYLCLVTINRARALVVKEIATFCAEDVAQ